MSSSPGVGLAATPLMVARPGELLKELREGTKRVKILKAIKNQVIGNKFKKSVFVSEGAVELVLEVLRNAVVSSSSEDQVEVVQQQAAIVIGSLSLNDAGLRRLISHEGVPYLVQMLNSSQEAVVEAGLWAIKMAVQQSMGAPSYLSSQSTPLDGHASALDPSVCSSASAPATTSVPAAATTTAVQASAPFSSMTPLVRLDAAAMSAVVRCLITSTGPATNCSTFGNRGLLHTSHRSGRGASIAALAAAIVACCSRREEERDLAIAAGAAEGLLSLLLDSERPDTQGAALEGLSLMLPFEPSACALALSCPAIYSKLLTLLRDMAPEVRLLAASCVATLSRILVGEQSEAMQRAALPVLLRLLAQPSTRPQVPAVLARLIEGSEALQKAAADADTVRLLAGLLAAEATAAAMTPVSTAAAAAAVTPAMAAAPAAVGPVTGGGIGGDASVVCSPSSRLREGCLRALGSLCLNRDDSRKQLLEAKVLRHIVRALEDPSSGVRAAAALCVRALSRCVRTLRGGLLEGGGGELASLLVGLLGDEDPDVQASAAAAVCNLVLDFSAAKSAVLAAGGLGRLVVLTSSPATPLRHHATWALANLLYRADNGVRVQLMQALPWSRMRQLLSDSEPGVVEQALVILRNLCMGDRHHIAATMEWADGPAAGAAAASTGMRFPVLHTSHSAHGYGQIQSQLQGTGGYKSEEGLLDVLQAHIQAAAAMSSAAAAAAPAVTIAVESESESYGGAMASSLSLAAGSPSPSLESQGGMDRDGTSSSPPTPTPTSHTIVHAAHALYAVANLLTGGPAIKDVVTARRQLLAAVAAHLRPAAGELALPAVWCAINLTWPASSSASGGGSGIDREGRTEQDAVTARCRALVEIRGAELLEELGRQHPSRDVQERARTALDQLRAGAGLTAGGAAGGTVVAAPAAAAAMGPLIVI